MTTFTDDQLKHINKISAKDEAVRLLWEEYQRITTSNYKMLLVEVNELSKVLTEDLKSIRDTKGYSDCTLITNDQENKGLHRLLNVVKQVELFNVNLTGVVVAEEKKSTKKSEQNVPEL